MALILNWTDQQIEDAITKVLSNITGLDPNAGQIRLAYSQQGQPSWTHEDTVVAYYLRPSNDPMDQDIDDTYKYNENANDFNKKEIFTQVLECRISCYGPNCKSLATLIRAGIQSDENRLNLSKVHIYPVPKVPPPTFAPYEYNKQWWSRADVYLLFNVYTTISSQVNRIESAEVKIITKEQGEIDVNITSNTSG